MLVAEISVMLPDSTLTLSTRTGTVESLYNTDCCTNTNTNSYSSVINNSQWYLTSHLNLVSNINEPHLISAPSLLSRNGQRGMFYYLLLMTGGVILGMFPTDNWLTVSGQDLRPGQYIFVWMVMRERWDQSPHLTSPLSSDQQWVRRLTNIESSTVTLWHSEYSLCVREREDISY